MENRELAILEIIARLKFYKDIIGVKTFRRTPTAPVSEVDLPCVFLHEDVDDITKTASRDPLGYPVARNLEIYLEVIVGSDVDIELMYRKVRAAIFKKGAVPVPHTHMREVRTEGPTGYGLPGVLGIKLVIALSYHDEGVVNDFQLLNP